jgi:gentisate 1,2-dioxygenase
MIWLDVLDLPLMVYLDVSYVDEGTPQAVRRPDYPYASGGLAPVAHGRRAQGPYPLLRYEWQRTREALQAQATRCEPGEVVQVAYVNPETGGDCLNTFAFAAMLLRPGEEIALPRNSAARVFHVVDGAGDATVDATAIAFEQGDTFCAPGLATVRLANRSSRAPLHLVTADESPLQRKLGVYEER